jgi:hypothetical protein
MHFCFSFKLIKLSNFESFNISILQIAVSKRSKIHKTSLYHEFKIFWKRSPIIVLKKILYVSLFPKKQKIINWYHWNIVFNTLFRLLISYVHYLIMKLIETLLIRLQSIHQTSVNNQYFVLINNWFKRENACLFESILKDLSDLTALEMMVNI